MQLPRVLFFIFNVLIFSSLVLLASGRRILVWEVMVNPGDRYIVAHYGDLGANNSASLACHYFTGRSIITSVYWYAPNGFMGKDQCPFMVVED
jgi:hypothetical protein